MTTSQSMPISLAEQVQRIEDEVNWLHAKWNMFRQLFGTTEERIQLLNACSPTFFFMLQHVLMDDVTLGLARLSDPARIGSFQNLSLENISIEVNNIGEATLYAQLETVRSSFDTACADFRARRHRTIAHNDLCTLLNNGNARPLPGVSRADIENALTILREFMNAINGYYYNSETVYEQIILHSSSEDLISAIARGLLYEHIERDGKIERSLYRESEYYAMAWG